MSLGELAASATVYDTIEDVARDSGVRVPVAAACLVQYGIASVDGDGNVTMSEQQSRVAARWVANIGGAG